MQEVLHWAATAQRVVLAGAFALAPGLAVWLLALGVFVTMRWLACSDLVKGLRHSGGAG